MPVINATASLETLKAGDVPYNYGYLCDKNKSSYPQIKVKLDSCTAPGQRLSVTVTVYSEQEKPVENIYPNQAKTFGVKTAGWSADPQNPTPKEETERPLSEKGVVYEIKYSNEHENEIAIGGVVEKKGSEYCLAALEPGEYEIRIDATKEYTTIEPDSYRVTDTQQAAVTVSVKEGGAPTASQASYEKKGAHYEYYYAGLETHSVQFTIYSQSVADTIISVKADGKSMDIMPEVKIGTVMLTVAEQGKPDVKMQLTPTGQVFSTADTGATFLNDATVSANIDQFRPDIVNQLNSADLKIELSHTRFQQFAAGFVSLFNIGGRIPPAAAAEEIKQANENKGGQVAGKALPQVTGEQYTAGMQEPCKSCLNAKCLGTTIRLFKSIEQCAALYCTEDCG